MGKTSPSYRNKRWKSLLSLLPLFFMAVAIVLGVQNIGVFRMLFIGATGDTANIVVDTNAVLGPMPRPWRNLAQGGESKDWRLQPVAPQVKALNPEYIRIDHIYDFYDIVSRQDGRLVFNWSKLDLMVSDILAVGAKPYLSLSYMPPAIAKDGDVTGMPNDWGEYQLVVRETVEHFSKTRGIEGVVYEVWNEPDLFGAWKVYGEKNYLTLYRAASQGATQAAQSGAKPFLFGGPATTALYQNWVDELLPFVADNNLRMDFYSWHRYDREVDAYTEDFKKIDAFIASHPQFANLELHITEWGHDSKNDTGYDGVNSAAHTVAVATEMVGKVKRGFVFEIEDGLSPEGKEYWGRWGLLTHNTFGAKKKSRYEALRMLDRLGDQRLQILGKGSWVKGAAAKNGDVVTVVLANYDSFGRHAETVPLTFTNLPLPDYAIDLQYLDGIRRVTDVVASEGMVKTEIPMLPNGVAFIQLIPRLD